MTHTDDALTEAVAKVLYDMNPDQSEWSDYPDYIPWPFADEESKEIVRNEARVAIAAVRQFDEQAALNCGHCTPNSDEIACQCKIEERDDE